MRVLTKAAVRGTKETPVIGTPGGMQSEAHRAHDHDQPRGHH
jgi:hypothetical protein